MGAVVQGRQDKAIAEGGVWNVCGRRRREGSDTNHCVGLPNTVPTLLHVSSALAHSNRHDPRCVVHFYHADFKRCEIMHAHLAVSPFPWSLCVRG